MRASARFHCHEIHPHIHPPARRITRRAAPRGARRQRRGTEHRCRCAKSGAVIELAYHANWLADTADHWTRGNGISTFRTKTPAGRDVRTVGASNFAGHEVDLTVKWKASDRLTIDAGYSHFFAGDYLADTGASDGADFAYVQASITF